MVVVMQVPRAVATRSVGENASPLPLLSVGASVAIFDCDGPCVASQCKSPVYLIEMLTMSEYATHCARCHVWQRRLPPIAPRAVRVNRPYLCEMPGIPWT